MQGEKSLSAARSAKARASRKSSAPDAAPRKSQSKATAALEAELQRAREQALRALAELENHRKRAEKERAEAHKYGAAALATDLLSVADNLRRALDAAASAPASAPDNDAALPGLLEGVRATERELQNVFRRHHIQAIDPKGEAFDPHCHEALYEVESREQPPGTVLEVAACGYRLEERLLRPARVGVAKAPAGDTPAGDTPAGEPPAGETPPQSPPAKPDNS